MVTTSSKLPLDELESEWVWSITDQGDQLCAKNKLRTHYISLLSQTIGSILGRWALLDSSPAPDEVTVFGAESDAEVSVVSLVD